MDIFKRKHKQVLPPLFTDDELTSLTTNYNGVIDFLTGLSDEDYTKTIKVAEIYRKAEAEAAEALGIERAPETFINPPTNIEQVAPHINHKEPRSFLDEDDELSAAFLEDEIPPTKPKGKGKVIKVDDK